MRCDWPHNPEWTDDMYQSVKLASRSYESTEQQVSINLGYKWKMLTDKEFKVLRPQVQF